MLAELVQPGGKAVGVEHVGALVERAGESVRMDGGSERSEHGGDEKDGKEEKGGTGTGTGTRLVESGAIKFIKGDGRHGCVEEAPFDAIHVGAAASEMHAELVEQLKRPGR